jgi:hypothetical protein
MRPSLVGSPRQIADLPRGFPPRRWVALAAFDSSTDRRGHVFGHVSRLPHRRRTDAATRGNFLGPQPSGKSRARLFSEGCYLLDVDSSAQDGVEGFEPPDLGIGPETRDPGAGPAPRRGHASVPRRSRSSAKSRLSFGHPCRRARKEAPATLRGSVRLGLQTAVRPPSTASFAP